MACESCDSCNGTCNKSCNSCNTCNTCDSSCQGTCQSSKQKVSDKLGSFQFRNKELQSNNSFLTAEEWNSLLQYIENGYGLEGNPLAPYKNGVYTYKDLSIRAGSEHNLFMSANMYNGAIAKMRWASLNEGTPGEYERTSGDIIYASYFTALQNYANNNFKVNYCNTCDNCNSCNSKCQGCNSCNSCNSCQGTNSCCHTPSEGDGGTS